MLWKGWNSAAVPREWLQLPAVERGTSSHSSQQTLETEGEKVKTGEIGTKTSFFTGFFSVGTEYGREGNFVAVNTAGNHWAALPWRAASGT